MKSLNHIQIIGNCGSDPVTRQAAGSQVSEFSVATSAKWSNGERTDWHRIVAWGKLAEIVEQYVRKGGRLYVSGSMQYDKYTDKNGVEKTVAKINARDLILLGQKGEVRSSSVPNLSEPDDDLPF
jgi:single-strand DNA-binding protein